MLAAGQFDHLGEFFALGDRRDHQTGALQRLEVFLVGLVAMAVPLGDDRTVDLVGQRVGPDVRTLRAQAHRATQVGLGIALLYRAVGVLPFVDQRDHRVRGLGLEFGRVGTGQPGDMARELDRRDLHAQADAQVGQLVLAGVLHRDDLALDATLAEAAWHQDGVELGELVGVLGVQCLGVDIVDLDPRVLVDAGVAQRFVE